MSILEKFEKLVEVMLRNINMPIALFGKVEQNHYHNHYHYYGDWQKHASDGSASSGRDGESESGKDSLGAGDCSASGDGESETPNGMPE